MPIVPSLRQAALPRSWPAWWTGALAVSTLLAVVRGGVTVTNPKTDFRLQPGDHAVVVAEGLGGLSPLDAETALTQPEAAGADSLAAARGTPAVSPAVQRWRRMPSAP